MVSLKVHHVSDWPSTQRSSLIWSSHFSVESVSLFYCCLKRANFAKKLQDLRERERKKRNFNLACFDLVWDAQGKSPLCATLQHGHRLNKDSHCTKTTKPCKTDVIIILSFYHCCQTKSKTSAAQYSKLPPWLWQCVLTAKSDNFRLTVLIISFTIIYYIILWHSCTLQLTGYE